MRNCILLIPQVNPTQYQKQDITHMKCSIQASAFSICSFHLLHYRHFEIHFEVRVAIPSLPMDIPFYRSLLFSFHERWTGGLLPLALYIRVYLFEIRSNLSAAIFVPLLLTKRLVTLQASMKNIKLLLLSYYDLFKNVPISL